LRGDYKSSYSPLADCVREHGNGNIKIQSIDDIYKAYLKRFPSAAPKFHAWVDPTAPSRSPPLSEPSWAHVVHGQGQ